MRVIPSRLGLRLIVLLVLAQVIRPKRQNPDVVPSMTIDAVQSGPADVHAVFEHSCKDCHSNDTRWLWYSVVGPVSWLIAHDVNRGRGKLNFSEWASILRNRDGKS